MTARLFFVNNSSVRSPPRLRLCSVPLPPRHTYHHFLRCLPVQGHLHYYIPTPCCITYISFPLPLLLLAVTVAFTHTQIYNGPQFVDLTYLPPIPSPPTPLPQTFHTPFATPYSIICVVFYYVLVIHLYQHAIPHCWMLQFPPITHPLGCTNPTCAIYSGGW